MGRKSAEKTAIKHAKAILRERRAYPILESMASVVWVPKKDKSGKVVSRMPISHQEDLFGVFDLLQIRPGRVMLVQVTTWTGGGGVAARRRKVRKWCEALPAEHWRYQISAEVWAWVAKTHMRRWRWDWPEWVEIEPALPPGFKRGADSPAGSSPELPLLQSRE
jgi:hypothetical protein